MAELLSSYLCDEWFTASDGAADNSRELLDASTSQPVARWSHEPVDLATAYSYARTVGGPALRRLTFTERAAILKQLAGYLNDRRESDYYPLSLATGATLFDSKFDVDGGIGVLFAYSSRGRRELPDSTVYLDGPVEQFSKDGSFVAQHIYTSRRGLALFINAFNFPVWGMLEKFAPAFLAGVPVVVKPAAQTAYLTAKVFADMVESQLLPPGAISLICAAPEGLLDHLTGQDVVSFTGSAATARQLRQHPVVNRESVKFTAEADSLNCAILGPDAVAGQPEFDLFIRELAREITVKAGQKCTAIRRAFVPSGQLDAVIEALSAKLAKVVVGDPRDEGTTMGALATVGQRDELAANLQKLAAGADVVIGGPDSPAAKALPATGAFVAPTVLRARSATAEAVHSVEPFGPVATLIGYQGADEVVELAALGEGSLVGSVYSYDPGFVREVVLGAAAHHGRLLVVDRDDARSSTGHGSPLPLLVHGGPGRAGGGEELGGIRGVLHYMQRTAVQGSPRALAAVTGRWTPGAPTITEDAHPFRKHLEDLAIGQVLFTDSHTVTAEDIDSFVALTGDSFYAHTNPEAAAANPLFGGIVAHGYYVISRVAGLFVDPAPGPVLANYGLDNLRFITPVKVGDSIRAQLTCKEKKARQTENYGEVRWDLIVRNQDDELVATYDVLTLVAKRDS
ncbi:MAG TPA: phenylacetic acid degradation bifunctional protein PaaZ [Jatrophihabitans sp.]|jgi:oxepin-CoA hydrolase/3-oxo-5,6-dehydrosuberyl-CoA semialdehyde dehydrogenase|uniref:phenylacetic acid degradation bifunctional protein PaaZ n=1 Tax=Jatrophihabitans sp. TaxID=1932789 RepID=UPI002EEE75B1